MFKVRFKKFGDQKVCKINAIQGLEQICPIQKKIASLETFVFMCLIQKKKNLIQSIKSHTRWYNKLDVEIKNQFSTKKNEQIQNSK